jgi:hypothetical protein
LAALYQAAAGAHLALTREIDAFACDLQKTIDAIKGSNTLHFGANGPLDLEYFQREFSHIGMHGAQVISVKPRNSPVDLTVFFPDTSSLVGFIALFLACRTKFEISQIPQELEKKSHRIIPQSTSKDSLVVFKSGFSVDRPSEYEINLRTVLPRSLLLDLKISISVSTFKKAKDLLVEFLGAKPSEKLSQAHDIDQSDAGPNQ